MLRYFKKSIPSMIKRGYAEASPTTASKLKLTLAAPHQLFIKDQPVGQVNISTTDGDLGILAGHVPVILQLRPGLIEVFTEGSASAAPSSKKTFFVSGGFATVNPDSSMQVAGMEVVTLDQLDPTIVAEGLRGIQTRLATSTNASTEEKSEISILNEVYSAMSNALAKAK